jgi:spoIIIJ-associated protein
MMREAVGSGKTVEEAIDSALAELNIPREEADITILELPSRGLFGILPGKDAMVHVRERFDPVLYASDWVENLLAKMHVNARVSVRKPAESIEISVTGQNLGPLIGRRGQTLDALQYLTTLSLNKKTADFIPVSVDVGDYRKKRQLVIERTARSAMNKVVKTGNKVILNPMSPAERRLVHMALSEEAGVVTYSIGEEPRRKVVIDIKRD